MKAYNKTIMDEKNDLRLAVIELQDKAAASTAAAAATRIPQKALVLQRSSFPGVGAYRLAAQQLPFVVMCVRTSGRCRCMSCIVNRLSLAPAKHCSQIRSDDGTEMKFTRLLDACETWLLDTGHVENVLPVSSTANILLYGRKYSLHRQLTLI